jgi:HSP20 family molecular chaperone IbpA
VAAGGATLPADAPLETGVLKVIVPRSKPSQRRIELK